METFKFIGIVLMTTKKVVTINAISSAMTTKGVIALFSTKKC